MYRKIFSPSHTETFFLRKNSKKKLLKKFYKIFFLKVHPKPGSPGKILESGTLPKKISVEKFQLFVPGNVYSKNFSGVHVM